MAEKNTSRMQNDLPEPVKDPRQIAADKSKGVMSIGAQEAVEQNMVDPRSGEIAQTFEIPLDAASKFQAGPQDPRDFLNSYLDRYR